VQVVLFFSLGAA
jgi:hypothetical protein